MWEAPRFLLARSRARRELSMEAARKLGDAFPIYSTGRSPLPQEDVTVCWIAEEIKYLQLLSLASRFKPR